MDLMLVLLAVSAFPVACLGFVLWMGVLEDSIPAGVRRAVREPDPPPILAVPVRRTAVLEAPVLSERVLAGAEPVPAEAVPAPDAIPQQRTAASSPHAANPTPAPVVPLHPAVPLAPVAPAAEAAPVVPVVPAEPEPLTGT